MRDFLQKKNMNDDVYRYHMKVQIEYASDIHQIIIMSHQSICVRDLQMKLYELFSVPPNGQRLVYKGIDLHCYPNATLESLSFKNNSLIRFVGVRFQEYR
ncbi:unnamed protein product [Rotaria sordida]|uniref:Ubiquitin-like domain-containing protein n=2 Tax=Rotaria sordida TaxID=392033 RepID=A0A813VKX3_9BILA|nr:unnamed protein product [Rotaria sordida]CAF0924258.1 unnamed protein product [Rotaria sordida]